MKKHLLALGVCLLAATSLLPHTTSQARPGGQIGPVLGKPVTATETHKTQEIGSDGSRAEHVSTGSFYRDKEGRMRVESSSVAVIYDPVAGFMYTFHLKKKTYGLRTVRAKLSVFIAVVEEGVWSDTGNNPSHGEPAGTRTDLTPAPINGFKAHGSRIEGTIPAGTIGNDHPLKTVAERWYSDDLGLLLRSFDSDPRFGTASYELTNIVERDPDPARFRVPAEFKLEGGKEQ